MPRYLELENNTPRKIYRMNNEKTNTKKFSLAKEYQKSMFFISRLHNWDIWELSMHKNEVFH